MLTDHRPGLSNRPAEGAHLSRRSLMGIALAIAGAAAAPSVLAQGTRRNSTALDHYVTLGHSGLRVSPFALGTMTFGLDRGWGASEAVSISIFDRYVDRGGNFIDTANGYTDGHAETIIGDHLAGDPAKRRRLVIGTKFSANMFTGDPNGGGTGRKAIITQCEESLRRLRTDYIDLYWMHHWDENTPIEETMMALNDLVQDGKVRYLGVSDTPAWKAAQAQVIARTEGWAPFIATQVEYSLAERTVEGEIVPMAQELGMGVMPWAPLAAGRISGKYTRTNLDSVEGGRAEMMAPRVTEKHLQIVDALTRIADDLGTTVPRVALAWIHNRPGVTATITGNRLLSHLEDNVQALALELPEEHVQSLAELTAPELPFPIPFLRENAKPLQQGGTTVNGVPTKAHPNAPREGEGY